MDALLRYILYHIAYTLLIFELIIMISCCIAIIIVKLLTRAFAKRKHNIQEQLSFIIDSYLFNNQDLGQLSIPKKLCHFNNLVEVLEKYNQRFSDSRWKQIKETIISKYLLPNVEQYASSFSWVKRQFAARCLLLYPQKASEPLLAKLLMDPRYLVHITAAVCITQTPYKKLFYEVVRRMSKENSLSQFSYRDALIQMDQEKFGWLEEMLAKEQDKAIIAICLDILSTRYTNNLFPLAMRFVNDPDRHCRILAIKALGNIPNERSIEQLIDHLIDSDWEIRAEAIIGLQKLYATHAIPKIRVLLNDPVWWVRLQAALALKNFGKEGVGILSSVNVEKEPLAYEISQYTLAMP